MKNFLRIVFLKNKKHQINMKKIIKILFYFIISIGFFWSHFDLINWVYRCSVKDEVFPEYYAAMPFIYKADCLASSMATEYYILGILLNSIILTIIFLVSDFLTRNYLIKERKVLSKIYFGLKALIILFSLQNIYISFTFLSDDHIVWKSDFRKDIKVYNADCDARISFFSEYSK